MSAEETAQNPDATAGTDATDTDAEKNWQAEAEKWQALARKHEERSKANAQAKAELDQLRDATASDQERAINAARREAATTFGSRLAEAQFRVAAAGRLEGDQLNGLLEVVDLKRFVDDNGDPDIDAITAAVSRVAPKSVDQGIPPDDHQGVRPAGGAKSPGQEFGDFLSAQINAGR